MEGKVAMTSLDYFWFVLFFFMPSLLIITFARRMVESNARTYPRLYGPVGRTIALVVMYVAGTLWTAIGLWWLSMR